MTALTKTGPSHGLRRLTGPNRAAALVVCLIAGMSVHCGVPPPRAGGDDLASKRVRYRGNLNGLERVADDRLAERYQRPGADLSGYTQILLEPLAFAPDIDTNYVTYRPRNFERVGRRFRMIIERELRGQFPLVDFKAEDVLRVQFTLTKLVANRLPDGALAEGSVSSTNQTSIGIGEAAMQVDFRDSLTDQLLVAGVDRYRGWPLGSNTNAREIWGDAEKAFSMWGRLMRQRLAEAAKAGGGGRASSPRE